MEGGSGGERHRRVTLVLPVQVLVLVLGLRQKAVGAKDWMEILGLLEMKMASGLGFIPTRILRTPSRCSHEACTNTSPSRES